MTEGLSLFKKKIVFGYEETIVPGPIQAADINIKMRFFDETLDYKWNKKTKLASFYEGAASIVVRLVMSRVRYSLFWNLGV